jgi:hypothetical protein
MLAILLLLCNISAADRAWIDSAVAAWQVTSRDALGLAEAPLPAMIFFDERCTADGKPHGGNVRLPDGAGIPAAVTSFAGSHEEKPFLVMALPSVWRKVPRHAGNEHLESMMRSVFIHEMTHTVQSRALGSRIGALIEKSGLPSDDVDDDIVQKKFGADAGHTAAYEKERDLFYAAAGALRPEWQRRLVADGLAAMRARRSRFLSGDRAVYGELEDLFLMMEGTANWAAYRHLRRTTPEAEAIAVMRGSRWWTQDEGLGIFLALDQAMPGWHTRVLGDDPPTLLELLASAAP